MDHNNSAVGFEALRAWMEERYRAGLPTPPGYLLNTDTADMYKALAELMLMTTEKQGLPIPPGYQVNKKKQ